MANNTHTHIYTEPLSAPVCVSVCASPDVRHLQQHRYKATRKGQEFKPVFAPSGIQTLEYHEPEQPVARRKKEQQKESSTLTPAAWRRNSSLRVLLLPPHHPRAQPAHTQETSPSSPATSSFLLRRRHYWRRSQRRQAWARATRRRQPWWPWQTPSLQNFAIQEILSPNVRVFANAIAMHSCKQSTEESRLLPPHPQKNQKKEKEKPNQTPQNPQNFTNSRANCELERIRVVACWEVGRRSRTKVLTLWKVISLLWVGSIKHLSWILFLFFFKSCPERHLKYLLWNGPYQNARMGGPIPPKKGASSI